MTAFWKTETLADRLRALAEELESAERFGLPLPWLVSISASEYGTVTFHTDDQGLFDQWADYTDADVTAYDHASHHWQRAVADVNGLHVQFATATPMAAAVVEAARESAVVEVTA